jgi:hypothetical protein
VPLHTFNAKDFAASGVEIVDLARTCRRPDSFMLTATSGCREVTLGRVRVEVGMVPDASGSAMRRGWKT